MPLFRFPRHYGSDLIVVVGANRSTISDARSDGDESYGRHKTSPQEEQTTIVRDACLDKSIDHELIVVCESAVIILTLDLHALPV